MSVNRAYITSLWTTGILVASSLLVLALTSALVAFNGWPGNSATAPVDRVTIGSPAAEVVEVGPSSSARRDARPSATGTGSTGTVGGVLGDRTTGGTTQTPRVGTTPPQHSSTPDAISAGTKQPSATGPSAPKPQPRPGDPVRTIGNSVGDGVGYLSPDAGATVRSVAGSGADTVDALPSPG